MRTFKVLSIDGGGIKGYYSAVILRHLENNLQQKHGREARLVEHTDLICGTSTGGLIAMAMSLGISAEDICRFYEKEGPKIFKNSTGLASTLRQVFFGGKFSDIPLRKALTGIYGTKTLGDSKCLLCIPVYDYTHGTYGVFKYDHNEGRLSRHNKIPMVDVGLATSAAPTFFPLAQIALEGNRFYADGGVWANNPSLVGLTEALWHFVGPNKRFERIQLLSVSSLNQSSDNAFHINRHRGFIQWAPSLFNMPLVAQSEFTHIFLELMTANNSIPLVYKRLDCDPVRRNHDASVKLDIANKTAFELMRQYADDTYFKHRSSEELDYYLTTRKSYLV